MIRYNEDDFATKVEAAVRKAAEDVVRVARQTGTPVITVKDGQIVELPPDQVCLNHDREPGNPSHPNRLGAQKELE